MAGKKLAIFILLSLELVAIPALRWPEWRGFSGWAFADWGSNFTLQYLIGIGLRPGLDFGYPYGLLSALVGRVWFACFGATPDSYVALMLTCGLTIAWAFADIAESVDFGLPAVMLLVVALPHAIQFIYPNVAHALEAALLANALALHSRGRLPAALCLTTAAVFAKPALAFVYGLILLFGICQRWGRAFVRRLLPAAITAAVIAAILSEIYGFGSLSRTIIPIAGMSNYRALGWFGHFASGFWWRPDLGWQYYVIGVAGFWIAASLWLALCTVRAVAASDDRAVVGLVGTCLVLHVAFVSLMFGNGVSWIYYSYILAIGAAATTLFRREVDRVAAAALIALALVANFSWLANLRLGGRHIPVPGTLGIIVDDADRFKEWLAVQEMVRGHKTVVLTYEGEAGLLFSSFEKPTVFFLIPGITLPNEGLRQARQISDLAVVAMRIDDVMRLPGISEAIGGAQEISRGRYFSVYKVKGAENIEGDHLSALSH